VITRILGREKGFFSSFSWANAPDIQLSIQECEAALTPLLDFLERNLKILNDNLTDANLRFVVLKIWKQILRTIDDLILPPLSEFLSDVRPLDEYELHVLFKWLEVR
jgi:hypothetical protein